MAEAIVASLQRLAELVRRGTDSQAVFNCINTRLIIQTGVNLKKVAPEQDRDPALVDRVTAALRKMNVRLEDA